MTQHTALVKPESNHQARVGTRANEIAVGNKAALEAVAARPGAHDPAGPIGEDRDLPLATGVARALSRRWRDHLRERPERDRILGEPDERRPAENPRRKPAIGRAYEFSRDPLRPPPSTARSRHRGAFGKCSSGVGATPVSASTMRSRTIGRRSSEARNSIS